MRYLLKVFPHIARGVEKPARHAFKHLILCAYFLQYCLISIIPVFISIVWENARVHGAIRLHNSNSFFYLLSILQIITLYYDNI